VQAILERLRALEQIHKDSPNLASTFEEVSQMQEELSKQLKMESNEIEGVRSMLIEKVREVQSIIKEVRVKV
jgi:septal ring factor EnvC (AmiA/AmiB activator)